MTWRNAGAHGSSFLLILAIFALLQVLSCSQSQAMKRGRDWMELKRYDEAISEFRNAIQEDPKNVEARYLIASCYHMKNEPLDSLTWIHETLSVDQNYSGALSLRATIQQEGLNYLASHDKHLQSVGLRIIEDVPSSDAVPALRSLMMSSDTNLAAKSESLMLRISPSEARAVYVSWLVSPNQLLREAGADKLWVSERNPQAALILREKYGKIFLDSEYGAREAAEKLVELGWPEAVDTLLSAVRDRSKVAKAVTAADLFAQRKEKRAVPALMERFSAWLPGGQRYMGCSDPYPQFADALGKLGAKEAVPLLKEAVSNKLSSMPGGTGECLDTYLTALATLTGDDAWKSFPRSSAMGFGEYMEGIKDGHITRSPRTPSEQKVYQWLQALGRYEPFSNTGVRLNPSSNSDYVKVHSPTEMKYYGEIVDSRGVVVGAYVVSLGATGGPERGWVWTDVMQRRCDRCGQNAEETPANLESLGPAVRTAVR